MVPNYICINLSQSHEGEIIKKWYFIMKIWHLTRCTKNAKNAIFQFLTWFLTTFPSTQMDPWYLKKNFKSSSTRIYHKLPSRPTHARVIALAKCIKCGWTVGKYIKFKLQEVGQIIDPGFACMKLDRWLWLNNQTHCHTMRQPVEDF